MAKWGVRSMFWYVLILIVAFCISLVYYSNFMNDPAIQRIFFE